MREIINNLRNKPHHVRRSVLHLLTIGFGIILLILWVYSLGTNVANPEVRENFSENIKPFYILKDNVANGINSFSNPTPTMPAPGEQILNPGYPSY